MFAWCLISGVLAGSSAVPLRLPGTQRAGRYLNTLILADGSEAALKSSQGSHLEDEDVTGNGLTRRAAPLSPDPLSVVLTALLSSSASPDLVGGGAFPLEWGTVCGGPHSEEQWPLFIVVFGPTELFLSILHSGDSFLIFFV